jgi:hypothetical protein
MNNNDIWEYIFTITSKDDRGNVISPDERTSILVKAQNMFFNDMCNIFERTRIIGDALSDLVVELTVSTDNDGQYSVPANYAHLLPFMYNTTPVDVVSKSESINRRGSAILLPTLDNPICSVFEGRLNMYPKQAYTMDIMYISEPISPFYDYYIDSNGYTVYMEEGSSHNLNVFPITGEVYRDGTTSGSVNSISKELSFPDIYKDKIIDYMLQQVGIYLEDQGTTQLGMKEETKTLQS